MAGEISKDTSESHCKATGITSNVADFALCSVSPSVKKDNKYLPQGLCKELNERVVIKSTVFCLEKIEYNLKCGQGNSVSFSHFSFKCFSQMLSLLSDVYGLKKKLPLVKTAFAKKMFSFFSFLKKFDMWAYTIFFFYLIHNFETNHL